MEPLTSIDRLSLNTMTTDRWTLQEAVDGCARAGIGWIAPWRNRVAEAGLKQSGKMIRDAGLRVSSLCRGGMFPAGTAAERAARIEDNRRAIEEAAELGAEVLVLVCGPSSDKDIGEARKQVLDGIEQLVPYAREHGVKLGIEPLHPMYAAERSVIVKLSQANTMAEQLNVPDVGVVVDVFHLWWDPDLYTEIARAGERILGFHVNDWLVPVPDMLMGRGMMGDGVIELRKIRHAVEAAGYKGPIEVEIFNRRISDQPGDETLEQMKNRYLEHV
ncbi:sugar phosphate isomerase/epimerase family protein [Paenibacillus thalictri]|uniref:Sugar phosphate isomerase/epimerase n=1 Tax=Paenibacillus thalictri TaxID=2527873 RepID=A0A4Q9DTC2_9BACL|nr:sugar phosphate isomerase/epimerase family protein [Paenibacillus thalictri]TBL79385.1 sugar phosphate isomerase/epimerase [Paenibacillus thalictri]